MNSRWKTEWLFDGQLSEEYSYQKLLKSDNSCSSYSRKCSGCFLRYSVVAANVGFIVVNMGAY